MNDAPAHDDRLMMRAVRDDPACFAELFDRHHRSVHAYLWRLCGRHDEALDLTQETFLNAFRARRSYQPRGAFRPWLYRIATNLYRSRLDAKRREERRLRDYASQQPDEPLDTAPTPGATLEAADRRERIRIALGKLSVDEREVIILRHFQGMPFSDIARTLDANVSTVKSRMKYGLDKLAVILGPKKDEMGAT